jgi:hypothetical protein
MKPVPLAILLVCMPLVFSCGGKTYERFYCKSFFIHETSFDIDGEVFVNDSLTEQAEFSRIFARINSVENWEIEGIKKEGNKFELPVDVTANGITLSSRTIIPDAEGDYRFSHSYYGTSRFPKNFQYCVLNFYVDVRRARGAIEPELGGFYYYVYIPQAIDISGTETHESSDVFGSLTISESYYDLNFSQPGWYKVYQAYDEPIGNKAAYSSGSNTKIRTPK